LPADAARRLVQADELPQVAQLDTVLLAELVEICLVTACSTPGCCTISHIAPLPLRAAFALKE